MKNIPYNERFNSIRELVKNKLVELGTVSIGLAVAQYDEIIWEEGFGWADMERRILSDPHTMYSLASISKPITATGLMILKERGLLDLDCPVNNYLGEAKPKAWIGNAENATVRRVANHTSGLPLHYHFFYEDEPYIKPQMDETIRRYGNLITAPGEKYQYSNIGYGILDYVISRLSGKIYEDFMRQEVFLPLDMTHTSVNLGKGLKKYQAVRYGIDGLRIPFYDFDHPGGSAVFSSAHDLVRFGMFHLKSHLDNQKSILSDEAIDEMKIGTAIIDDRNRYGVGWASCDDFFGYRAVWHNGGMGGVSTTLMLIPDEKIAVVVLANSSSSLPDLICKEILSLLLPKFAEKRAEIESRPKEAEKKRDFSIIPELIGKWEGKVHTYKEDILINFVFKECGDIIVSMGNQLKALLNEVSFNDGYLLGQMNGNIGTEDANKRPYYLHINMKLRDNILNGAISAISLPGQRMGNALSHWIEIWKI